MTPELWQQLKPLYHAALEMPEAERASFLARECRGDNDLMRELTALFQVSGELTDTFDAPLIHLTDLFPAKRGTLAEGQLLLGRFRIVRRIGAGGMGDVYEAMDLELGRIALKTIRPEIADDPHILSQFKKEAQLARKVSGPHVCRIHELFVAPSDEQSSTTAFLTMEYLEGITLAEKIQQSGALPWKEARAIALQICAGLQTIHEAGMIHRDLKSRNIMLASRNGADCAVVMDFGLARAFCGPTTSTQTDFVGTATIAGTPDYMAPEQFEGKELGPPTDIYALGIVIYELATGKHPFAASTPLGAAVSRGKRPPLPSSIQRGLPHRCDEIIGRCLGFDPKSRYQSAKSVAADLDERFFSPARLRKNWVKALLAATCLILILSSLLLIPAIGERVRGILFSSRQKHIAVLPIAVAGGTPETLALGDGLMDSLAGKLSNLDAANQSLWVVPASEVRHRNVKDPRAAQRELGATIVVEGGFERNNQATHLKLTLIDPNNMREIGFVDVESPTGDLAALQDEAVTRLGRLMNISLGATAPGSSAGYANRAAYEDYLTGLGFMQRYDKPGNLDSAIASFRSVVDTDPHFALGLAQLGEAYRLKYQLDKDPQWLEPAQAYCIKAIKLDDRTISAYVTLAHIHKITGKPELALQEFQHALDKDPRDASALNGLASVYESEGHASEAEAAFQKAAALRPDYWNGYDELGNFYDRQHKYQQAFAEYKHAIELTPDNAQVYSNLGSTYIDADDPKLWHDAEKALKQSIALSPSYTALANLGVLYGSQNRYPEYAATTEQALQLDDHDWMVWGNLVAAYEWLGEFDKANVARGKMLERLEQTVKLTPQDATAQSGLAVAYAHERVVDKALSCAKTALALAPDDPGVLSDVAEVYELLGRRRQALGYIQKAFHKGLTESEVKQDDPYLQKLIHDANLSFPPK
jgi:serine/threonine protein kinase/tetratricopeptide (TPR) repeat protein